MKQYITPKQLNELSKKGKINYFEWCWKKGLVKQTSGAVDVKDYPLLSIGQMIEFLDENNKASSFLVSFVAGDYEYRKVSELADALWQACKEILNG